MWLTDRLAIWRRARWDPSKGEIDRFSDKREGLGLGYRHNRPAKVRVERKRVHQHINRALWVAIALKLKGVLRQDARGTKSKQPASLDQWPFNWEGPAQNAAITTTPAFDAKELRAWPASNG
jgi:hypothetical protein